MSQDVGGRLVAGRWTLHTPLRRARRGVVWRASEPGGRQLAVEELRLPVRRVAQLGLELLDALEAAHAAGLPHLDLRPASVLVTADGHARLAGIGLTTLRTAQAGERSGTAFRAPEQVRGDPAGPAADLWSLGTILYLAVEGETPSQATAPRSPAPPSSPSRPMPQSSPAPLLQPSTRC